MRSRKLGFRTPLAERFWPKVDKRGPDECWPWLSTMVGGYGQIWDGEKRIGAHRASLIIDGRDPGNLDALHSCDNPICVNPAHLRPGTEKENAQDSIASGTFVQRHPGFGEANCNSVLTEDEVRQIRMGYKQGASQNGLARSFGVSRATIQKCISRETWKQIP